MSKAYKIVIREVENGYSVKVGCKKLVFNSRKKMLKALARYLKDPVRAHDGYGGFVVGWDLSGVIPTLETGTMTYGPMTDE